jgi:hypothetical protein
MAVKYIFALLAAICFQADAQTKYVENDIGSQWAIHLDTVAASTADIVSVEITYMPHLSRHKYFFRGCRSSQGDFIVQHMDAVNSFSTVYPWTMSGKKTMNNLFAAHACLKAIEMGWK